MEPKSIITMLNMFHFGIKKQCFRMFSHWRSLKNHERRLFAKRSPKVPKMSPTWRQHGRQNHQKSDQKYDREDASFLDRFLMPKCSQNGGQNGAKMGEKGTKKVISAKMASKKPFWVDLGSILAHVGSILGAFWLQFWFVF